jgi:Tfp pilus assembly protein PilF
MEKFPGHDRVYYLILILAILLVYFNSFQNAFQFDDFHVLVKNPFVKSTENILKFFWEPKMGSGMIKETSAYRPLLMVSFVLNYALWGLDPWGYHLFNVAIHILCSIFVYLVALEFLRFGWDKEEVPPVPRRLVALFAALIFAVHPIQTESVTYISGRSSSLLALFYLAAFYFYMRQAMVEKVWPLIGFSFFYAVSLLVKETAVTLPVILILFDLLFPLGRTWKKRLLSLLPAVLMTTTYLVLRLYFFGSMQYGAKPLRPFWTQLLLQPQAWVHYLGTLILPLNLSVDYEFVTPRSFWDAQVLWPAGILVALALVLWRISKARGIVGFFALWFTVNLLPTNSLVALEDIATDRWVYSSVVGYAVLAALAAYWVFQRKILHASRLVKIIFFFVCFLVVESYGHATLLRNFDWYSYWTLWEDAAAKAPHKARPRVGLGLALNQAGKVPEAIKEFEAALRIAPNAGEAHLNLGYIYFRQRRNKEAISHFQQALKISPLLAPECHNNMGAAYRELGRDQEAVQEFQLAIQARPIFARPYANLGIQYEKKGEIEKAISYLEKATELDPELAEAYFHLTQLYEKKGYAEKSREAAENLVKYLSLGSRTYLGQ